MVMFCLGSTVMSDSLVHYVGKAYDIKTKEFLYKEEYKEFKDGGDLKATSVYTNKKNDIIARKELIYKQNFQAPCLEFYNEVTGVIASVNVGENMEIAYRSSFSKSFKRSQQLVSDYTVVDSGLHYYIVKHWDALLSGKETPVRYVSPSKRRDFLLSVKKNRIEEWRGRETVLFKVQPQSFFLRLFLKPIMIRYELKQKRLITYQGISNIKLSKKINKIYMELEYF
ncbi:hypothetical protein DID78_03485 [Candidatus Marinamargulisbacteria bacterium SCGC AG-343-D04]|nr:hypothetical protein DID78_03485 [Candidatus Marinamargulisbacteria bacterium SCGC AG-343-D04]